MNFTLILIGIDPKLGSVSQFGSIEAQFSKMGRRGGPRAD